MRQQLTATRSSLRRIQTALSAATETFAAELARPGSTAPRWSAFEWTMAQAAAVLHGVTPLLAARLQWPAPDSWNRFATGQFEHVRWRHQRIEALLQQLHETSAARQLGFVALKGSALHALGVYQPGQRPMADIDLLVRPADEPAMTAVLSSLNYQLTCRTWRHGLFTADAAAAPPVSSLGEPFAWGEHRDAPLKIELHTSIAEPLPIRTRDITPLVLTDELTPGRNTYPSKHALLMHLLLHAAGNMVPNGLRLIHVYDIALLARRLSAGEWAMFAQRTACAAGWALPALQLSERYFPGSAPPDVLAALRRCCPAPLRRIADTQRLSELSYARLWVRPFPGFEWSGSLRERIECMWHRVRPNASQRSTIRSTRMEMWAQNSSLQQPRPVRIMRQLLLRPPRPQTMYVVRAALAAAASFGNRPDRN